MGEERSGWMLTKRSEVFVKFQNKLFLGGGGGWVGGGLSVGFGGVR